MCQARGGRGPEGSDWGNGAIGVVVVTPGASALARVVVLSTVLVACAQRTHAIAELTKICAHTRCRWYRQAGGVGCIGMMVLGAHLW